jgi:DNA-binding LytR/AlgR family response regulator
LANRKINHKNQNVVTNSLKGKVLYPVVLTIIVGVCIGLLGPFGMNQLPVTVSVTYWVITCLVGYVIYQPVISILDSLLSNWFSNRWYRVAIGTVIASTFMSVMVPIINRLFFADSLNLQERFFTLFPKCLLVGGIITTISMVLEHMTAQKQQLIESEKELEQSLLKTDDAVNNAYQAFMKEIPIEKRGKLLCLEMSDHYVKVYTDKGYHLVLMRFKDALQSLESYPGLQTHRSWWVANDAIIKVKKEQRKIQLILTNNLVIPVSRTFQNQVVDAGFSKI